MFATMAMTASQLGIPEIQIVAAGRPDNGYYTWPRIGFDSPLSDAERTVVESYTGRSIKSVADLMVSEDYRQWWREHGTKRAMNFNLKPDSYSMRTLRSYLSEKGIIL